MREMVTWKALNDHQRQRATEEAQKLLRWCASWADQVRPWGHVVEGQCVRGLVEEENRHLTDRLDATVVRVLSGLKKDIARPLVPLYVAVWTAAMEIEAGEIPPQVELAIVLAMVRVQSTARFVHLYNKSPGDKTLAAEMKRRGLIRR